MQNKGVRSMTDCCYRFPNALFMASIGLSLFYVYLGKLIQIYYTAR